MPKNGNLMKFWESLEESSQQSSDLKPPLRPNKRVKVAPTISNLKMRSSVSHSNVLGFRQNIGPSKEDPKNLNEEKTEGFTEEVSRMKVVGDELKDDDTSGRSTPDGDGALPLIQRHEVLTNATKGRARRTKNQPTKLVKQSVVEVPDIRLADSEDKKVVPDIYQTPPAASTEFVCVNTSPTSAGILNKSPISVSEQVASPRPVKSLSRTPFSFSTFLSNPLKESKSEEPVSIKKEAPEVPQRKLIPCSPKLADRYKEKIETIGGELQTALSKRSPMKFNSPKRQNSSNADINQRRSSPMKLDASPKADFLERRNSLKAVTSPYKATKDSIAPLNFDKLATFTSESSKAVSNTLAVVALNKGMASTTNVTSTDSRMTMTNTSSESSLTLSNAIRSKEPQDTNINFKEYRDYMENKIVCLENNLAAEKLAREHLEKEVEELKLIVTRLDKN